MADRDLGVRIAKLYPPQVRDATASGRQTALQSAAVGQGQTAVPARDFCGIQSSFARQVEYIRNKVPRTVCET